MPYATVNGIRMHYETHGAGDPVLLISGLGGPGVGWLFQVRDLSPRYHVITFDNRGVGGPTCRASCATRPVSWRKTRRRSSIT